MIVLLIDDSTEEFMAFLCTKAIATSSLCGGRDLLNVLPRNIPSNEYRTQY